MVLSALRTILCPKVHARVRRPAAGRVLRGERLEERWVPATLTVDGDGGRDFTTIAAAIAAARANDTIQVFAATEGYAETLNIPAGKTGLKIVGREVGVMLTSPADVTPDFQGGEALIDIRATKVEIRNLTLDGSTNTDGELHSGIRVVENGSAVIRNNTITGLKTTNNGQFGIGVQVGGSSLGTIVSVGTAKVENNVITDYSGAGVLVDAAGSSADVRDNTITGRGEDNGAVSQYGVQVSFGATARVERNTITNNTAADNSAGVLLYQVGGKQNVVTNNTIDNNEFGIWLVEVEGTGNGSSEVLNNDVTGSHTPWGGIQLDYSDHVSVKNNFVSGGAGDGIGLYESSRVEVKNNESSDNGTNGIYVFGGSRNEIQNNDAFGNGGNGVATEDSDNNWLVHNRTSGNGENGVEILGGTGNVVWQSTSYSNTLDGLLLNNTSSATVIGNLLGGNGGAGLRLVNSQNAFVALNVIQHNGGGPIVADSTATHTLVANWTDEALIVEEVGIE